MTTKQTAETKVTAENITDEQIRELIRASCEHDVIVNLALGYPDLGPEDRRIARERCAELWNLRAIDADGARGPSALISADERNLRDHANALLPSREWHALDAALTELHELRTDRTRLALRCRELEGEIEALSGPRCEGCGSEIDPEWCWCGSQCEGRDGHPFIEMGCNCLRDNTDRDWKRTAEGLQRLVALNKHTALARLAKLEGSLGEALDVAVEAARLSDVPEHAQDADWYARREQVDTCIASLRKELPK